MDNSLTPTSALISVYDKSCLSEISSALVSKNVKITSTGGTEKELSKLAGQVSSVENETGYPSILGGRVKTLHPKIFGGILQNPDKNNDLNDLSNFDMQIITKDEVKSELDERIINIFKTDKPITTLGMF